MCTLRANANAFPIDLFGFEKDTFLAGGGWISHLFSTRLRVLKLLDFWYPSYIL
jgi:hypothetical protein